MITGNITMDKEVLEIVAGAAAQKAAQEIALEVRSEITAQFEKMKSEIKADTGKELAAYFGESKPHEHIVEHNNLKKLLRWYDDLQRGFWTKALVFLFVAALLSTGGMSIVEKIAH